MELTSTALKRLLLTMKLARALEEQARSLQRTRTLPPGIVTARGSEATAVGAAYALKDADMLAPGQANIGALLMRGVTAQDIMAHWFACDQHPERFAAFGDMRRWLIVPGTSLPVAVGTALGSKLRGEDRVMLALCTVRDTYTGAFYESVTYAYAMQLPTVFVVRSDGYRARMGSAAPQPLPVALPHSSVDGNDLLAITQTVLAATRLARSEKSAVIVVADTSNVATTEDQQWQQHDPIQRFVESMLTAEAFTADDVNHADAEVAHIVAQAVTAARRNAQDHVLTMPKMYAPQAAAVMGPTRVADTAPMSAIGVHSSGTQEPDHNHELPSSEIEVEHV